MRRKRGGWRGGGEGINKNGIHSLHQNIFHTEQRVKHENLNRVILEEGIKNKFLMWE